jgi:hypothetical protein
LELVAAGQDVVTAQHENVETINAMIFACMDSGQGQRNRIFTIFVKLAE